MSDLPEKRGPGRPIGAKNKKSLELGPMLAAMMEEKFGIENYDPVMYAVQVSQEAYLRKEIPVEQLNLVHLKAAKYVRPELKAIEHRGHDGGQLEIKMQLITELAEELD